MVSLLFADLDSVCVLLGVENEAVLFRFTVFKFDALDFDDVGDRKQRKFPNSLSPHSVSLQIPRLDCFQTALLVTHCQKLRIPFLFAHSPAVVGDSDSLRSGISSDMHTGGLSIPGIRYNLGKHGGNVAIQ